MRSARRRAREVALQGLYQWQATGDSATAITEHLSEAKSFGKADQPLFSQILQGVMTNAAELEATITPLLDRKLGELSPVERCILLVGAYELAHMPETPYRVVINEAIELAKAFGGTDGHRYVNGVLDKLAPQLRPHETTGQAR
ncbi:MAG: transcription antitermination factor NusB [Rhodocyclaceae bacterium]